MTRFADERIFVNTTSVLELGISGLKISMLLAAPLLISSMIVGIIVSLVQVATSLQDATLTFVPKLAVAGLVLILIGPWMMRTLVEFTGALFAGIPGVLG